MTQENRNEHIDIMKGFAILLVLLGHRFMTNTLEGTQHPITIIIYSFHMAFFFFISGYVNEYTNQLVRKGPRKFLYDKIRTILLPYFVWTLICFISNGDHSFYNFTISLNFYPEKGYWFLPLLFIFFIIYLIINKLQIWGGGIIFITFLVGLGLIIKQVFPIWYASYFLSFILGGYMANKKLAIMLTKTPIYGTSALILTVCWFFYPLEPSQYGKIINLCVMFIIALASCITFFNFFKRIVLPNWIKKYFTEIGKYTLVLYLVPILILPPHSYKIDSNLTFTTINLIIIIVAIIHSLISYVIGRIVYEIPYLRLILFGKK